MKWTAALPIAVALTAMVTTAMSETRSASGVVLGVAVIDDMQSRLDDIASGLAKGAADQSAAIAALLDACKMISEQPTQAIQQMILWSGRADAGPSAMLPLSLVVRCGVPDKAVATAIAPMLNYVYPHDRTALEAYKKFLSNPETNSPYELLMMFAFRIEHPIETNGTTVYDFSCYLPILQRGLAEKSEVAGLFRHIFSRSPLQAIEVVARSTGDQRIIQSLDNDRRSISRYLEASNAKRGELKESLRQSAETSLESAARDKRWWVRLFAVEIANKHPEIIDEERLRFLAKDRHPAVRGAVDTSVVRKPASHN